MALKQSVSESELSCDGTVVCKHAFLDPGHLKTRTACVAVSCCEFESYPGTLKSAVPMETVPPDSICSVAWAKSRLKMPSI